MGLQGALVFIWVGEGASPAESSEDWKPSYFPSLFCPLCYTTQVLHMQDVEALEAVETQVHYDPFYKLKSLQPKLL